VQELALAMTGEEGRLPEIPELAPLLRLAKAGDAAAFEQILILHERRVFFTALRMLGCVEDAQDAAQEVFLKLHKHLRGFDHARAFSPWLYRMTVNVCRNIAVRRRRDEGVALDSIELQAATASPDLEEERRIVRLALRRLPGKERAALVLRDIEGLPTAEVARALGSSEATVRSQVSSARLKIKRFVDGLPGRR
jgi:RNA polymerase sigma-70 factor (ECF subfamily)